MRLSTHIFCTSFGSFNSRTREGCDCQWQSGSTCGAGFNSRTREGCDPCGGTARPSRGCFNSRTREGCDLLAMRLRCTTIPFQFTHPGGVRRSSYDFANINLSFNSRTREGCDVSVRTRSRLLRGFNSRTREGCDARRVRDVGAGRRVSIHAPGRGATSIRPPVTPCVG